MLGGWRENSLQEAAGLLFHPPALLLGKEERTIRRFIPTLSHFAKAKEKEGEGKSTDPVLMKSAGSKLCAPARLARIYLLYPRLLGFCELPKGRPDKKNCINAFPHFPLCVRNAEG